MEPLRRTVSTTLAWFAKSVQLSNDTFWLQRCFTDIKKRFVERLKAFLVFHHFTCDLFRSPVKLFASAFPRTAWKVKRCHLKEMPEHLSLRKKGAGTLKW